MSVARLSVGVDQLSSVIVCTVGDMKHPDDFCDVYGQTSESQYVCTVWTEEPDAFRCLVSVGRDAIDLQAANQESPQRCKITQGEGSHIHLG